MTTRPYIVEFTGTPEAGKTTCIKSIIPILAEQLNCKISYIQESAELLPSKIPKGGIDANLWMFCITIHKLLESIYDSSNDIIIIDRGIFDKCFFGFKFYSEELCSYDYFLLYLTLAKSSQHLIPNLCIHFTSSPEESIRRRGGEGRLVTTKWLNNYNHIFDKFLSKHIVDFGNMSFFSLDTTCLGKSEVAQIVIDKIANLYTEHKNNRE